jgi:KUP system potassium uptake protein
MLVGVVSLKYLAYVTRANRNGEAGILTLMTIVTQNTTAKWTARLILLGLVASGFFFGEAVITPAISVLSAVEGLEVISPHFADYVMPISIAIITGLFFIQKHGTEKVGNLFAPVMLVWFIVIGALGVHGIMMNHSVLDSVNPIWAIRFFEHYKMAAFFTLSFVVLAVTGVEALTADMGHVGIVPIRLAWFAIVLPALLLNYFGQGALLLTNHAAISEPFFLLAPKAMELPLIILATFATIIASQAVISGIFSLTRQAINFDFLPSMRIHHTSEKEYGQIYIPIPNWILYVIVVGVMLGFKNADNLAAAYGIAVSMTMMVSGIFVGIVARRNWNWPLWVCLLLSIPIFIVDLSLFSATSIKVFAGGWLPLVLGTIIASIMIIWRRESQNLNKKIMTGYYFDSLLSYLDERDPCEVEGIAVYLTRDEASIPYSLLHNIKHNKVIHEKVIFLTFKFEEEPYVHNLKRVEINPLSDRFYQVTANYGFKETPDIENVLYLCGLQNLHCHISDTSFFAGAENVTLGHRPWYHWLGGFLFVLLKRNSLNAAEKFQIPFNKLVELGIKVEI